MAPAVFRDTVLTGKRIGGMEARTTGIVDEAVPLDQVQRKAVEIAAGLAAKDRGIYRTIKREMYRESIELLEKGVVDWEAFKP
jgi:enoyl-CoA hydratase/carnithine racemase